MPTVDRYFSGTQGDLNSDNYNSPTLQQDLLTDLPKDNELHDIEEKLSSDISDIDTSGNFHFRSSPTLTRP